MDSQMVLDWHYIGGLVMDSQIGLVLVLDWQLGPGFALSWKTGAALAFCVLLRWP